MLLLSLLLTCKGGLGELRIYKGRRIINDSRALLGKNGTIILLLKQASELIKQFDQGDLEVEKIETQIQDSLFKCMLLS